MKIIGLDPSSTVTGFGILDEDANLLDGGLIKPPGSWKPERRIDSICADVWNLIGEECPDWVVMELPDGKVHGGKKFGGAGLSMYGRAAGNVERTVKMAQKYHPEGAARFLLEIMTVSQNLWTQGKQKKTRAHAIALRYPTYDMSKDRGLDMADGIGLALWGLQKLKERSAVDK